MNWVAANGGALQIIGVLLASLTAVGCILYERLVANLSYSTVLLILLLNYGTWFVVSLFLPGSDLSNDWRIFRSHDHCWWWAALYIATGASSVIWYYVTRQNGVLASSVFEAKYVAILAVIYLACGAKPVTWSVGLGLVLAIASLYFISRP
jgi:hypothetical protein